jgi:Replication-relaxation
MFDPGSSQSPSVPRPGAAAAQPNARPPRLQRPDRALLALLGVCRYLTASQVASLRLGGRTEKGAVHRLRRLSGEAHSKGWPFSPALVRALAYRAFDGEPLRLWGLTPAGCSVAAGELGRALKSFRSDVGAVFAEHFVFLTELFVRLARPHLAAGVLPRALPFRWNVAEDVELPWRDRDEAGCEKSRVIRPDAVLELPGCERRLFIECEMGTNPLTSTGPDKAQATVRKVERYDAYVSGFADVTARLSHYRRKYPDGWPCEVLFLVQSESRRRATAAALRTCLENLAGSRLCARAFTLEEAVAHCAGFLTRPEASAAPPTPSALGPMVGSEAPFYGEREHGAVKDFVLDMTAALAEANTQLRRHGLDTIPGPASKAPMLDFLRKAQAEMQRRRGSS